MRNNNLVTVFGCFTCKKLAGNLFFGCDINLIRKEYKYCPQCSNPLTVFSLNTIAMKFEEFPKPIKKLSYDSSIDEDFDNFFKN